MKKILSIALLLGMTLLSAGCGFAIPADPDYRDEEAYIEGEGFAESLKSDYLSFRQKYPEQKNDIFYYINAQNHMPEGREVKYCLTDISKDGWREAGTMDISSSGVDISDEQYIFSFGKHFPVETVLQMSGHSTVNELFSDMGQVQTYAELDDICAFSVNHNNERPRFIYTIFYGKPGDVKRADIDLGELEMIPDCSIQLTEHDIYYFAFEYADLENSSIIVAQIPLDGSEIVMKKILCSELGLPAEKNGGFCENIFVEGGYLFFLGDYILSTNPEVIKEFCITAYDLVTDKFDVYKTRDLKGMGKLFRYSDGLGVTTALYDERGYFSDMGARFLDFDMKNCKLSHNKDILFAQSKDWAYDMGLSARDFYCIGDKLCGVLTYKSNGAMLMYVEIDLKTGEVTTCVPFAKNDCKETHGWVYGSVFIRDNGKGVSQHNCSK